MEIRCEWYLSLPIGARDFAFAVKVHVPEEVPEGLTNFKQHSHLQLLLGRSPHPQTSAVFILDPGSGKQSILRIAVGAVLGLTSLF